MSHNDRKLWIENMNADRFSGKAGGFLEKDFQEKEFVSMRQKQKGNVSESLYFALMAKKFLETPIKVKEKSSRCELFIEEIRNIFLYNMFQDSYVDKRNSTVIEEENNAAVAIPVEYHEFAGEMAIDEMQLANNAFKRMYETHPILQKLWDYYILDNGVQKDNFTHGKLEWWTNTNHNKQTLFLSPSLGIYNGLSEEQQIDGEGVIINVGHLHQHIDAMIAQNLGLDSKSTEEYIADLIQKYPPNKKKSLQGLLHELGNELLEANRNHWNILLLATIISSYTHSPQIFSRMAVYKIGSANEIAEDIILEHESSYDTGGEFDDTTQQKDDKTSDKDKKGTLLLGFSENKWLSFMNKELISQTINAYAHKYYLESMHQQDLSIFVKSKNETIRHYKELVAGYLMLRRDGTNTIDYRILEKLTDIEENVYYETIGSFDEDDKQNDTEVASESLLGKKKQAKEVKKIDLILEQAIYEDPTCAYLIDPGLFERNNLHMLDDDALVEFIESSDGVFEKFIGVFLYFGKGTSLDEMYDRLMQYDYVINDWYEILSFINQSLELKYPDADLHFDLIKIVSDYMVIVMEYCEGSLNYVLDDEDAYRSDLRPGEAEIRNYIQSLRESKNLQEIKEQFVFLLHKVMGIFEDSFFGPDTDSDDIDDLDEDDDF